MSIGVLLASCTATARLQEKGDVPTSASKVATMASTPATGRMVMENPEATHMMSPITAPTLQAAIPNDGQPHEGDGTYSITANFSMSGNWKITIFLSRDGLSDYQKEFEIRIQ